MGKTQKAGKKNAQARLKTSLICFCNSVAGDPGNVATDWRLLGVQSVEAFPGTVELEPAKTQIPRLPYKHYTEKPEFH